MLNETIAIAWFFNTGWYVITMTIIVILVGWDVTGTRQD